MRDPGRLDTFYTKLNELHRTLCPDTRFGQLMIGFSYWLKATKGNDGFYTEDNQMIEFLQEYFAEITHSSSGKSV